jgi:hypothetical protein
MKIGIFISSIVVLALPFLYASIDIDYTSGILWMTIWPVFFPIYFTRKLLMVANYTEPSDLLDKVNIIGAMFLGVTSSIAVYACEYAYFGLRDTSIQLDQTHDGVVRDGFTSLYFSVVTWTTLGYGDFVPAGRITRFFAAWEALTGYLMMAVLISALVSIFRSRALEKRA